MTRKLSMFFAVAVIMTMAISASASAQNVTEGSLPSRLQATAAATEATDSALGGTSAPATAAGGPACIADDGDLGVAGGTTVGIWTNSRVILLMFKVESCTLKSAILMLNPQMTAKQGGHADELFVFYFYQTVAIQGNQFSFTTRPANGTVTLKGTFTSATEVEGTLSISKGTQFQSNKYASSQYFKQDFTDTWQGTLKGAAKKAVATAAPTKSNGINHPPIIAKGAIITTTTETNMLQEITGVTTKITIDASDPDGDILHYRWASSNGTITGNGPSGTWRRALKNNNELVHGTATVTVTDGRGGEATYTYSG